MVGVEGEVIDWHQNEENFETKSWTADRRKDPLIKPFMVHLKGAPPHLMPAIIYAGTRVQIRHFLSATPLTGSLRRLRATVFKPHQPLFQLHQLCESGE